MRRSRRTILTAALGGLAVVAAACGGGQPSQPAASSSGQPAPTTAPAGTSPAPTPVAAAASQPTTAPTTASQPTAVPTTASKLAAGALTIYSGRSKTLIDPLLAEFGKATGIEVKTRYGSSSELAAALLEEGKNSPADLFFAQDAGALGAVSARGLLTPLPEPLLKRVDERFRAPKGEWVGLSGRARVIAYNTKELKPTDLPETVSGLTEARWKDKLGWAPTNASFQAFVTAMRLLDGEAATRQWLQAMKANNARAYKDNEPLVEAIGKGEVAAGLTNHYYLFGFLKDRPDFAVKNHYPRGGAGAIVNVAGAGLLASSKNIEAAKTFLDYALSLPAQQYFADKTYEYPLITGVKLSDQLPPLADIKTPALDLSRLADLETTLKLLTDVGIV